MQRRAMIILLLALASAGVAAYLAVQLLGGDDPGDARTVTLQPVAVAAQPLSVGHIVTEEDVRMVEWPSDAVPAGFSESESEVVGRGVITPVATNEPLLASKLAREEAGGGLPIVIPEGKRAMSVAVNEVIGVAGFVLPGTYVDVLVTAEPGDQGGDSQTQVVLQDVRVLSAGQMIERTADGQPQTVSVVTLLVGPEEAETLTLAADYGRLQLALRNTLDRDSIDTEGMVATNLLPRWRERGSARPATSAVRRPPSRVQVEVYRGPQRSTSTVDTARGGGR